jgi:hypothetical protein
MQAERAKMSSRCCEIITPAGVHKVLGGTSAIRRYLDRRPCRRFAVRIRTRGDPPFDRSTLARILQRHESHV